MALFRPRLTDYHGISAAQADLDFAIPFLDEDVPLYADPFLLWKSPSQQDESLHGMILRGFNHLGYLMKKDKSQEAIDQLVLASECDEVGLGVSATRKGKRIGPAQASEILSLFSKIPNYQNNGFEHFEEIQFFVNGISKDRISDFTCNFIKSFLIDFTIDECKKLKIPVSATSVPSVYSVKKHKFETLDKVSLPTHPDSHKPLLFVPRRWLRFSPWLNFEEYFRDYCPKDELINPTQTIDHVAVLNYNRDHYGMVEGYVKAKELSANDCVNDPLFSQIPIISAKRSLNKIKKLETGKTEKQDQTYEDEVVRLLSSLLYPDLDFAAAQSRTDGGVLIRDLIFYNTARNSLLKHLLDTYGSRQLVFEIKNVRSIDNDNINQLNRYLTDELGKCGVLVTRNPLPKAVMRNLVNLWSGQRRCILAITDEDLATMVQVFETKQRTPFEVLTKIHTEFMRRCPS